MSPAKCASNTRRLISHQRHGATLTPFYYDSSRRELACMGVVDDFGDVIETPTIYGDVDVDVDDDSLEAMWPARFRQQTTGAEATAPQVAAVVEAPRAPPALDWLGYQRLKRKLDAWELDHLRELAAEQATQLEQQAEQIANLQRWLGDAEASCDMWQHHALELGQTLRDTGAGSVGLTRGGALVVLPAETAQAMPS